jgi:hypothetical protein
MPFPGMHTSHVMHQNHSTSLALAKASTTYVSLRECPGLNLTESEEQSENKGFVLVMSQARIVAGYFS